MASITLAGSLLDPNGFFSVGDKVRFTHKTNTGSTIKSAVSVIVIPPDGSYNITLQYGLIRVQYRDILTGVYKDVGVATVNQDSTATTLPELLNAVVPPTDDQLLEFQAILADCVEQANNAAQSATEAEQALTDIDALTGQQTTTDLINNSTTYDADKVLETSGFTTAGDGGAGKWKQNGVTGQTPSQTPAQLGDALLNDASGKQWALIVSDNEITARSIGVIGDGVIDDTDACNAAGSTDYIVDIGGITPYITDTVTFAYIKGNVVNDSYFKVDSSFNMAASSIVRLSKAEGSAIIGGVGVFCVQPDTSTRGSLNQYPWALDFEGRTRVNIDTFRCSGAWNGVNAKGNTGGAKINTLEVGAINEGLNIDGALDFWHANTVNFWPFGYTILTTTLNDIYYDGQTIGARIGKCDGLEVKNISSFRNKIITEAGSGIGPFGSIGSLQ